MQRVNIDVNTEYTLKVTGSDLVSILSALGELPHKVAGPLEQKIVNQLAEAGMNHGLHDPNR